MTCRDSLALVLLWRVMGVTVRPSREERSVGIHRREQDLDGSVSGFSHSTRW